MISSLPLQRPIGAFLSCKDQPKVGQVVGNAETVATLLGFGPAPRYRHNSPQIPTSRY